MLTPLARALMHESEATRLKRSLILLVFVHVALVFFGNERATWDRLAVSFLLCGGVLVALSAVRAQLRKPPTPPQAP